MSLFVIGDLHLSLSADKKMDVFHGWENYVLRLERAWKEKITESDSVILLGDISWGMTLEEASEDFRFINSLPGKKYLVKGNHDYWWSTKSKINAFFEKNNFNSFSVIHNSGLCFGNIGIAATRGWIALDSEPHDKKIAAREAMRLDRSICEAKKAGAEEVIAFLHYPPVYTDAICGEIMEVLQKHQIKKCFYGHIHSDGCRFALQGDFFGINFALVSADYLNFSPFRVF
ncbi:MAG: metallophosphoesterase [Oscillospiraceae bacterium]|nr:metallophosphoesterase [Oscillospiraceae bacterium]